jgi:hypothetical protein
MAKHARTLQPWVETVAGSIGDPVRRLRFIRSVAPLVDVRGDRRLRRRKVVVRAFLFLCAAAVAFATFSLTRATPRVAPPPPPPARTLTSTPVWKVESGESDTYSNGLRIDNGFAVSNRPRDRQPAGIVFHATESAQAPFEEEHNDSLKRIGESLLDYVRRRHSYHYLIDRFGRVYRVVQESDVAHHAGHSIWGDDRSLYIGLNDSFLGVAFEARSEITAAQIRSGAMLTEMLRAAYEIPAENCVTHAQVSVNPSNLRIGYHVDWAAGFPFTELGLPDNYAIPPPAIWAFGFESDAAYRTVAGEPLRRAIDAAHAAIQPGARARYRAAISASGRKKNTIPRIR